VSAQATAADVLEGRARHAIVVGDNRVSLPTLPDGCVQTCVTSPPYYGLRSYNGGAVEIGQETSPAAFVEALVTVFREVRRVLADDGCIWVNLGDSYVGGGGFAPNAPSSATSKSGKYGTSGALKTGGIKPDGDAKRKDLLGIPWMVAFALRADGWYLRSDIVWAKGNVMPESVTDRPTRSHEYVFLLSKRERYFYDAAAIKEPVAASTSRDARIGTERMRDYDGAASNFGVGTSASRRNATNAVGNKTDRNARTVWSVNTEPFSGAHFATMAPELARRCILAGSRRGDVVLDPFAGAGTTALVAVGHGRRAIGCELNPEYAALALDRVSEVDTSVAEPVRVAAPEWGALFAKTP
jgi:DNA modification methylase